MRAVTVFCLALALAPLSAKAEFLDNQATEAQVVAALQQEGISGVKVEIIQLRGGSMNQFLQGYQAVLEGTAPAARKAAMAPVVHRVLDPLLVANELTADTLEVNDSDVKYK